jgi:hypothetical protein
MLKAFTHIFLIALLGLYSVGMPLLQHVCLKTGRAEWQVYQATDQCALPAAEACCTHEASPAAACCSKFQTLPTHSSGCDVATTHQSTEGECSCCHTTGTQLVLPQETPAAAFVGVFIPLEALYTVFLGWHHPLSIEDSQTSGTLAANYPPPPLPSGRSLLQQQSILRI